MHLGPSIDAPAEVSKAVILPGMRRYGVWAVSAAMAVAFYFIGKAIGVPEWLNLLVILIGAIIGTALGSLAMQRLLGPPESQTPPPSRGSGRKAK